MTDSIHRSFRYFILLKPLMVLLMIATVRSSLIAEDLSVYKHWKTDAIEKVTAQPWRTTDDLISGWDWSLPPGIAASPNAFVNIHKSPHSGIPCRSIDQIRMTWRELEPEEGQYKFNLLREKIAESISQGYSGVALRIWASVWEVLSYPDSSKPLEKWPGGTMAAPRWLRNGPYNVPLITMKPGGKWQIVNCDIMDAVYHEKYKKFIKAFGESGIPAMPELTVVNLTYRSSSMGEEYNHYNRDESTATPEEIKDRTIERMSVWAEAFGTNRRKLMWVDDRNYDWPAGANFNDVAQSLGIGQRSGNVEMYYLFSNRPGMGQLVGEDQYLNVDEDNPFIKNEVAFGDENEEYGDDRSKFGNPVTFGYRYMMSSLMMLKMRRNYAMLWTTTLNPELLYWTGLELGRKVSDAPDIWCWLNEAYLSKHVNKGQAAAVKNIERWLYQRDIAGYETEPFIKAPYTTTIFYNDNSKPYDYVSRRGKKIGFAVDDRYLSAKPQKVAVKITYYDGIEGQLSLVYNDGTETKKVSCTANGTEAFKTATFFITASCKESGMAFDFEIQSEESVPINFVRVIKVN